MKPIYMQIDVIKFVKKKFFLETGLQTILRIN